MVRAPRKGGTSGYCGEERGLGGMKSGFGFKGKGVVQAEEGKAEHRITPSALGCMDQGVAGGNAGSEHAWRRSFVPCSVMA